MKNTLASLVLALSIGAAACGGSGGATPSSDPAPTPTPANRPNIIVIVTDDLDTLTVGQLLDRRSQSTQPLLDMLANQGLSFTHAYVTQPLCAPSRASIFTGQYSHNHGVYDNSGPHGGYQTFLRSEPQSLAPWLKAVGYRTALVGKYINDVPDDGHIPPGWDEFHVHLTAIEDGRYFNYSMSHNGVTRHYGFVQEDYSVDVEKRIAVDFISSSAGRQEPIFLYIAPQSPHIPAYYAERFGSDFARSGVPITPSFNQGDQNERTCWVQPNSPLTPDELGSADNLQRFRLRSMRAVEEELASALAALEQTGRLANTYVFFTSDNGLLMGQHRLLAKKSNAYEESINVPFMVRGPGVPVGRVDSIVANIDIAPTILDLAGIPVPQSVDGRSLAPYLRGKAPATWRRDLLIFNYDGSWPNGDPIGISLAYRDRDWMFQHRATEQFDLYDMRTDPDQLKNVYCKTDPSLIAQFEARINTLVACRGSTCRD